MEFTILFRFAKVLARTAKFLKAELPHLKEVNGITEWPYFKQLNADIGHNLPVKDVMITYLSNPKKFSDDIKKIVNDQKLARNIENADINLFLVSYS